MGAPFHGARRLFFKRTFVGLLRRWIRNKKFRRYLISQCYPIAIDGTQKSSSAAVSGCMYIPVHAVCGAKSG
jgi:hypothetical protein